MKKLFLFVLIPLISFSKEPPKVSSKIKEVTVYLSGAQITRTASYTIEAGTSEVIFTSLSPKIDESSIQVSGLQNVSILAMAYDLNYITVVSGNPEVIALENQIKAVKMNITKHNNSILGLTEEEKVITTNRLVSTHNQTFDLEQLKKISTYYRERITAIKNEIVVYEMAVLELKEEQIKLQKQLAEINNLPEKQQGEIKIKFDAPITSELQLVFTYIVQDAGWVPTYDIKSKKINDPLQLKYKAHVYQQTGSDWNNVMVTLSTGSPNINVVKPNLGTKYLDFVSTYNIKNTFKAKKRASYSYNPAVKKVVGQVVDASGTPLPGCNVIVTGTSNGTQTDFDGNFSIDVPVGQELRFSYLGYSDEAIPIYSSIMNIKLEEDVNALNEVVTVGYALQGKVSGVNVRGTSSITSASTPLYIVDGVPLDGFTAADLDPNEIQSIDVLKDASAQAIYGNRGNNGVIVIATKKSTQKEDVTNTQFQIKKPYSIVSDGDITAIEINTYQLAANYQYFAAPIINENVFLTAQFSDWEQYNLLPGEANIYFEGGYAGKTNIDPYTTKKEMTLSLGIDPNITVTRTQNKNFKSKSFTGSNRVLDRTYTLDVKNNKSKAIELQLVDRIPLSQNKEIKVDNIETFNANYDKTKGLLSWKIKLASKATQQEKFAFKVKYPKNKHISL